MAKRKKETKISEGTVDVLPVEQEVDRNKVTIQQFMDDMAMIGRQVNDRSLKKPNFDYGQLSITNYLLWLVLSELMISNTKGEVK